MSLRGWFWPEYVCPVDPETRRWIDGRWDWLQREFGPDRPRKSPVVLATPEFFPDEYDETEDAARRLLDRLCGYMDIDPGRVQLSLYDDQSPMAGQPLYAGSWNGTVGLYLRDGDAFCIGVEWNDLADPLALVATMAHELGHVHLLGHERVSPDAVDHEPLTDLLTVYFGLGVITSSAVIREKSWQDGQLSGWQVSRRGYLTMPAYGYALARFARHRHETGIPWSRELRPDVRDPFHKAMSHLEAKAAGEITPTE